MPSHAIDTPTFSTTFRTLPLVQPLPAGVEALRHVGSGLLPGSTGSLPTSGSPGDLQQRPRFPVHQPQVHRPSGERRDPDHYEWPRPCVRQHLHRASVAHGEMRRGLSGGLYPCPRRPRRLESLFRLPQSGTIATGARLSNPTLKSFGTKRIGKANKEENEGGSLIGPIRSSTVVRPRDSTHSGQSRRG